MLPVADLANADIALMQHLQWLALDQPLPDTLAPLLRNQVIPALQARTTTA